MTFEAYRGAAVLRNMEEGHVMHSEMGGGIDLRRDPFTGHIQFLHTGKVPLGVDALDTWVDVALDVNGLYKYEWYIVDE